MAFFVRSLHFHSSTFLREHHYEQRFGISYTVNILHSFDLEYLGGTSRVSILGG